MEDLRTLVRHSKVCDRKEHRESLLRRNRNIGSMESYTVVSKEDIIKNANNLKVRALISSELLLALKNSFLQDSENITTFLQVDGALQALVRALSGKDAKFQIQAAYCMCNLALGNKKQCSQIIKLAGPYLVTHLQGMNLHLIEACAWTIGNLCSNNVQCAGLLKTQGAFTALAQLLSHEEDDVRTAAVYALNHFVYTAFDILEPNDYQQIIKPAFDLYTNSSSCVVFLISLLSAQRECQFWLLRQLTHEKSWMFLLESMQKSDENLLWHFRIISNLISESTGEAALKLIHKLCENDLDVARRQEFVLFFFSEKKQFLKEFLWLLGNFLNHSNPQVQDELVKSQILPLVEGLMKSTDKNMFNKS